MNQTLNVLHRVITASILLVGALISYSQAVRFDRLEYSQMLLHIPQEQWADIPTDPASTALNIAFRCVIPFCMTAAASYVLLKPSKP
jgi:hypothetical protein